MGIISLIVRLLIAATFSVAGITKLADPQGTRKAILDFGLPTWASSPVAILLPLAEFAVAVLLIPFSTVPWGSLGAIALLLLFITGISVNLVLGRKPECNCFGQLHSMPIGWPTLARNCALVGGAVFVFWEGHNGSLMNVVGWSKGLSNAETVGIFLGTIVLVVMAGQGWLAFHLLRQNGRLMSRMDALETQVGSGIASARPAAGLPIGSPAPAFELPLQSERLKKSVTLDTLRAKRRPIILIFSDPDCGPCSALLPDIARWQREHASTLTIALISRGSQKANHVKIGEHRMKYVLLQKDREVAAAYKANGTPGAVLVGSDGKIASFLAMGSQAIADLIATGTGTVPAVLVPTNGRYRNGSELPTVPAELRTGDPAPSLKLSDISGKIIDLSSFRGRETLVVFWNPYCGFCAKMLPDLKAWEEDRPTDAPQLLVVSTGTVDANRRMGFRSPVVLDETFASGFAFHVSGTPAAVLVDAQGKIASGVATGAPAVFALANAGSHFKKSDRLPQLQV